LDRFEACYRRVIQSVLAGRAERLVLVSISASHAPTTRDVHEHHVAQGKTHNHFGRPDLVAAYNAVIRGLAEEHTLGYLDVYGPMRRSPQWAELTDASGVHLTALGDRFVASLVLAFLAESGRATPGPGRKSAPHSQGA